MKTFKEYVDEMVGSGSVGTTNVVAHIAGTGGKAGEPGVDLRKKKKNPIIFPLVKRK